MQETESIQEVKDEHDPPRKGSGNGEHCAGAHVSWDERVIAEHDELRGTRQKINEPNTPYHYGTGDEDVPYSNNTSRTGLISFPDAKVYGEEIDMQSIVSSNSNMSYNCSASSFVITPKCSEDLMQIGIRGKEQSEQFIQEITMRLTSKALDEERTARWGGGEGGNSGTICHTKMDFKKKRAAHYNEFQKMKEWKANQGAEWADDDQSDDRDSDSAVSDL